MLNWHARSSRWVGPLIASMMCAASVPACAVSKCPDQAVAEAAPAPPPTPPPSTSVAAVVTKPPRKHYVALPGIATAKASADPNEEKLGAKHVLVMYAGSMRAPASVTRTKDEARKRAEEALIKLQGGYSFEQLAADYSDEPNAAARGGDLGTFRPSSMVPEFSAAVRALKVGETSGIVETPFGFHIVLRTK